MSQENSTTENSKEKRKRIALGLLLAVFAGVIYYQFFSGSGEPAVTRAVVARNNPSAVPSPTPRQSGKVEPIYSKPLDLASMTNKAASGDGAGRNIFIYPPPPPPPTPKPAPTPAPTPPPPITLFSMNPSYRLARTGEFNLAVFGEKIPSDGKVYLDGREYPTTFISAKEVRAKVPGDAIGAAGNLGVMVRSVGDAKLYSNQMSLNIAEPPPPPYRFIGFIQKKSGAIAVLKSQTDDEVRNVIKDEQFGRWKVISISPQRIILEDTSNKVTHTLNFTGETG
ncbi:MAG: hypothetical protein L0220_18245 [Acidobacteria bacterium]|nr:hypothetical protein [Acidobacteriota bacterium]